ncbi:hypothetical protein Poli38472_008645 [Pythium oligandrum]|uniref:DNA-directed primase/polymerase protein n=1 Tax=Pythium oligandrum TaxID=41045 RepID=A0A8K1FDV9_PYTOL|nr:hypothetical protein Poli38472_008645 [Pythium oligandrum]|eukprot:TMW55997.1 hypothetical protein Poli38472_008645 [Pythium oligandrum]
MKEVFDAEESEMSVIPGRVRVEMSSTKQRSVRISRRITRGPAIGDGHVLRSLVLQEDIIRMIDVYSPTPFTDSVVLQVDVNDATTQCFIFSRVSIHNNSTEEEGASPALFNAFDREVTMDFLADLHAHLEQVPLSTTAREHLAARKTQIASNSTVASLKRRITMTPTDFYGRNRPTLSATSQVMDKQEEDSWRTFYQRLQFNVSRSLLCQLEGTAPLSATFPRQQEAFEFADQVIAFRKRLAHAHVPDQPKEDITPRLFCFEGTYEGKRRFWVATMQSFWQEYTVIPFGKRHVYEIIREGVPCRLYFDLEFKIDLNPHANGDALTTQFISLLQLQLYRKYQLVINPERDIVQLESSTPVKFSRHLTILFPNGELFVDNIHAGAFVRQFIHDLIEPRNEDSPFLVADSDDQKQLFVDVGVYTRNRMFRVLGSSKYHKTAVLRPLNSSPSDHTLDHTLFLRSLVCPYGSTDAARQASSPPRFLRCEDAATLKRYGPASLRAPQQTMRSVESKTSMYPHLDAFILSLATTSGIQGEIRALHLLYPQVEDTSATSDPAASIDPPTPVKIVYHMMRNRWCENIQRAHKSNNVMFVVDLITRTYCQRCHDPHCQGMDYRSPLRPLPPTLDLTDARGLEP